MAMFRTDPWANADLLITGVARVYATKRSFLGLSDPPCGDPAWLCICSCNVVEWSGTWDKGVRALYQLKKPNKDLIFYTHFKGEPIF